MIVNRPQDSKYLLEPSFARMKVFNPFFYHTEFLYSSFLSLIIMRIFLILFYSEFEYKFYLLFLIGGYVMLIFYNILNCIKKLNFIVMKEKETETNSLSSFFLLLFFILNFGYSFFFFLMHLGSTKRNLS